MEFQAVTQWLAPVALIVSIANTVWVWLSHGGRELAAKLKQYRDDLVDHDRRIQALEAELKHLPSKDDVSELTIAITELKGTFAVLDSELSSITRTVRRIEDHLREKA